MRPTVALSFRHKIVIANDISYAMSKGISLDLINEILNGSNQTNDNK